MVGERVAARSGVEVAEKSQRRQTVESLGLALLIAFAIKSSLIQAFWVPSGSMLPTIFIGDHLFVNKLAYSLRLDIDIPFPGKLKPNWLPTKIINKELFRFGKPKRGEVVVFVSPVDPETDLIKRVIAVEGDTVEVRAKKVFINGQPIDDPHAHYTDVRVHGPGSQRDFMAPKVVPDGKFFVMGDNRDNSADSRYWGFADMKDLKGRATFVYFSWPDWNRFGRLIR
jgi:signal peptidase I